MLTLEECKDKLSGFLELNPGSEIEIGDAKHVSITRPWRDDAIVIIVNSDNKIFDAINKIYLPERLSAVYHSDKEELEFIWTVFPVAKDIRDRNFVFSYNGAEYQCRYAEASDRLVSLANNSRFLKPSSTDHRNLWQFRFAKDADPEQATQFDPRSFFVKPIKWNENEVLKLIYHLNFYMSYYDWGSPLMLLHTPKAEERAIKPRTRYIDKEFPPRIDARQLDENLLHFWHASVDGGDASRIFLYYHRIIEYAAASYLDARVRTAVRAILAAPAISHRINETAEKLASVIGSYSRQDNEIAKIHALLKDLVDRDMVWKEVERNLVTFSSERVFEGGFKIPPLLCGNDKKGAFETAWPVAFYGVVKDIRNALSHGKDFKTQGVIPPTNGNLDLLRPWVAPLSVIAAQVVICQGIV